MSLARARPLDFLEIVGNDGRPQVHNRRSFGRFARQVSGSWSWTARDGAGELVAIAGVYPVGLHEAEAWFAAGPALRPHLRAVLQLARDGLDRLDLARPGPLIAVAYIHPSSVAGDRLAAKLGFHPCDPEDTPLGRMNTWRRLLS